MRATPSVMGKDSNYVVTAHSLVEAANKLYMRCLFTEWKEMLNAREMCSVNKDSRGIAV